MLRFGLGPVSLQRIPDDPTDWETIYGEFVELCAIAEESGFESVWLSEHHLLDDGYLSALFPLLAAVGRSTRTLMLGTGAALAPLYDPLRLAEDARAVQILSRGRLLLGLALGYRPQEFAAFGVSKDQMVLKLLRAVELIRDGPQPAPAVPVPVWLGGWAGVALKRAAALGDGVIFPSGGLEAVRERVRVVEAARSGPMPYQLPLYGWCSADGDWSVIKPALRYQRSRYAEWYSAAAFQGEGGSDVGARYREAMDDPEAMRRVGLGVVMGDPDDWIQALRGYEELFSGRVAHLAFRLSYPGVSLAETARAIRLIGREVIPAYRPVPST